MSTTLRIPTSELIIEPTYPLGGYRITATIDGYYLSRLYIGYTKQAAIKHFKRNITK